MNETIADCHFFLENIEQSPGYSTTVELILIITVTCTNINLSLYLSNNIDRFIVIDFQKITTQSKRYVLAYGRHSEHPV